VSAHGSADAGAVLGALVDFIADAVVQRLKVSELAPGSSVEAPSNWYNQDTSPLAHRTYLELCRSGKLESRKVGKMVLVQRDVLDAWILAYGTERAAPASPLPTAAPTNEELMRAAGFRGIATPVVDAGPSSGPRRRARRPGR
jgi:hypothetical protein